MPVRGISGAQAGFRIGHLRGVRATRPAGAFDRIVCRGGREDLTDSIVPVDHGKGARVHEELRTGLGLPIGSRNRAAVS
jgi:hypothetical protein